MKHFHHFHKLSVLHFVYQTIASAEGGIDEDRDADIISYALESTGFTSIYNWDEALRLDPQDCVIHMRELPEDDYKLFSDFLLQMSGMGGNTGLREICAKHILHLCRS